MTIPRKPRRLRRAQLVKRAEVWRHVSIFGQQEAKVAVFAGLCILCAASRLPFVIQRYLLLIRS